MCFIARKLILIKEVSVRMGKKTVSLVLVFLLVLGAIGVYAASSLQEIKATLNSSLTFLVHGAKWQPKDANGNNIIPISYNGTTYVPLRAVAEALNTAVDYDSTTKQITIGEKRDSVSLLSDTIKRDKETHSYVQLTRNKSELVFEGVQYEAAYKRSSIDTYRAKLILDLGKSYSKAHLEFAYVGTSTGTYTVYNTKDEILATGNVEEGEISKVDFDLYGERNLIVIMTENNKDENDRGYLLLDNSWVK